MNPNQVGAPAAAANNNSAEELSALRAEVERLEIAAQESRLAQQSKHNAELADIRGQFDESERRVRAYEMDVQVSQSLLSELEGRSTGVVIKLVVNREVALILL